MDFDARWFAARRLNPVMAGEILSRVCDEREVWSRLIGCDDMGIVLKAMIYLTDRRDGRPTQQINLTSMTINITPDLLDKARGIARDIVQTIEAHPVQSIAPKSIGLLDNGEHNDSSQ